MFVAICREAKAQRDIVNTTEERKIRLGVSNAMVDVVIPWCDSRPAGNWQLDEHCVWIMHFITNFKWRHTRDIGEHGTTWIELIYAYLFAGGTLKAIDDIKFKRVSLDVLIKQLRGHISALTNFYSHNGTAEVFEPSHVNGLPLKHLAVSTRAPSISLCVFIFLPRSSKLFKLLLLSVFIKVRRE